MQPGSMRRLAASALITAAALLAHVSAQRPSAEPTVAALLAEVNGAFTYRGEPINPRAVLDLLSWISDSLPGPVAVDLAGTWDSNRYYGKAERRPDGSIRLDKRTTEVGPPSAANPGWFEYRRLGTLASGVHVLETWDNGGGSGIFTNLLFVKFSVDQEHTGDGRRQRLVMTRLGEEPLGDRFDGSVRIKGNVIEIGANPRTGAAARSFALGWLK
jgi:hypothetical protein